MEAMSNPETILRTEPVRPLKRVEYERLVSEGFFDDERVELLFGMVVPMSPVDPAHDESTYRVANMLRQRLGARARVREQAALAASDVSEPQPDVAVVPATDYWNEHPTKAFLIVEVARSSLRRDKGPKSLLYGLAEVDEYWIVNHVDGVVEVYRDRHNGEWRQRTTHQRGDTIAMSAFPDVTIAVAEILPPVQT
ncbi:MAG TPA: Uma2 family endonuclease [Kofleriaceae bacterium]|nr:Uma2 family endonuclease [Kofleriaceae bacterium]